MQTTPTIEVVIQTYNRAALFERTLRSVCDQTYPDFTVKVFDNGSTDNTKEVYENVIRQYPERRFEYKRLNENHLDDFMMKEKCDFITADYVIVFHDDDLMHPRYVECLMNVLKEHPDLVMLGGRMRSSEHPEDLKWEEPTGKCWFGDIKKLAIWNFKGISFSYPTICYKSYWYKNTKYRMDLYADRGIFPFLLDIAKHGKICVLLDHFLHYRRHPGQGAVILPTQEQQINLIKKAADILLSCGKEGKEALEYGLRSLFIPKYIDFDSCVLNDWLYCKIRKRSIKNYLRFIRSKLLNILAKLVPGKRSYFEEKAEKYLMKANKQPHILTNESNPIIQLICFIKFKCYKILATLIFWKRASFERRAKKNFVRAKKRIRISADKFNQIRVINKTEAHIEINVSGKNNKIYVISENERSIGKITVDVIGDNNKIFIRNITALGTATIKSHGNNGMIRINGMVAKDNLLIYNGYKHLKITGGCISIGETVSVGSNCFIFNPHSNTHITIGKDCMLSDDISIRNTDGHPIYDIETKKCLNKVRAGNGIDIGDHVWIGLGATILKNAAIPNDSIVGTQAVVTKRFSEPNSVIAGNPAKTIKRNITWVKKNSDFLAPAKGDEPCR